MIRPGGPGLVLQTLYYHDEIRDAREIDRGPAAKPRDTEQKLAVRLIEELAESAFRPEKYKDEYRARVLEVVKRKAKGKVVELPAPRAPKGKVIDLMEALQQSLARKRPAASARRTRVAVRRRA
jgi:DNA end-binding protein Ku